MARITKTHGAATAHFVAPVRVRAVARWQPHEIEALNAAIARGVDYHEAAKLFPYRSFGSVKDKFYRACGWRPGESDREDCDLPASLYDARYQKDAIEGSAKLYQALIDAGLWVPLELRKAG
jgi:hypothetical protein